MSMTHVVAVATLVTLFALVTVPGYAHQPSHTSTTAQTDRPADDLDPTFGTNGQVISNLTNNTDAADAVLLPDDRILVLGTLFYPEGSTDGEGSDLMLMRFTSDGIPDLTFGDNGMVTASATFSDTARALIVQPDNNIVVTGGDGDNTENISVMRFTPDGTLDTTFGEDGITHISFESSTLINHITIQPDGKILLAGFIGYASTVRPIAFFSLIRFNADGSPDPTFGENGYIITEESDYLQELVIQPDGKIRVAGYTWDIGTGQEGITVAQYNPDGSRDTAFGEEGILAVATRYPTAQIHFLENNDLLAAMNMWPSSRKSADIALTKYHADGSVDTTFRSNETSYVDTGNWEETYAMAVSSTGQILLVGTTNPRDREFDIFTMRYAPDGTIEGAITTDLGKEEFPRQVLVQSDGKFVVVGTTKRDASPFDFRDADFFLLRYLNSPFNQVYLPLTSR